jgi:hypothetical protein
MSIEHMHAICSQVIESLLMHVVPESPVDYT